MTLVPDTSGWAPLDEPKELLRQLSAVAAPTGNEDRLTAAIQRYADQRGWRHHTDRLGQVAVEFGPPDAGTRLMLVAHLDELGLVVRDIEPDGWIRVHRLGGMPERILPGLRLVLHTRTGDLPLVVGTKAHHLTQPEEKYVAHPATSLYLDGGFASAEAARRAGVRIGDPITYAPTWTEFSGGLVSGKALDNRVGVAAMLQVAERLSAEQPNCGVAVVFSCLEEFNLKGPLTMAQRLRPQIALVVDIVPAADTPDLQGQGTSALGAGPSLSRMNFHGRGTLGGLIPHPSLVRAVEASAQRTGIDLQYDAVIGCLNDSAYLPMAGADGIATVSIGIPCRYTHSPIETAQIGDVLATAQLVTDLAQHAQEISTDRGAEQTTTGLA